MADYCCGSNGWDASRLLGADENRCLTLVRRSEPSGFPLVRVRPRRRDHSLRRSHPVPLVDSPGRAAPARPRRSWLLSFRQHTPSADLVPPAAPAGVSPGILQPSLSHRAGEVPPTRPPVRQAGDAASPELAIMAAARPTARCPYRGARAHHHARVENAREDIRGGGPAEQAGSRVLHRVDDLAQPDALGPGGSQPWAATPLGVGSGIIYQLHVFRCVRRESSDRRLDRVLWGSPRTHPLGSGPSAPGGLRGGRERGSGRRNGAG